MVKKNTKYFNKIINQVMSSWLSSTININLKSIINSIDYFLLTIVIFAMVGDFIFIVSSIINHFIDFFNINGIDFINNIDVS